MIDENSIPEDSMFMQIQVLGDGDLQVMTGHNFGLDMPEEDFLFYRDILNGLNMILAMAPHMVMHFGTLSRNVAEYEEQDGIVFEPDEELLDAVADAKVIHLKDRIN
jgi:hypothetical protein